MDEPERDNGCFKSPIQSSLFRTTLIVVVLLSMKILPAEDESERSREGAIGTGAIGITAHCKALMLISSFPSWLAS